LASKKQSKSKERAGIFFSCIISKAVSDVNYDCRTSIIGAVLEAGRIQQYFQIPGGVCLTGPYIPDFDL